MRWGVVVTPGYTWQAGLRGHKPVGAGELPGSLRAMVGYLAPLSAMYREDWIESMALAFWSGFWPNVRYENLAPNLWFLGVGLQGVGKNVAGDELQRLFERTAELLDYPVAYYTSGSVEGMAKALTGKRRPMLAYHREFASFLDSLRRMAGSQEMLCNLYDGADVSHHLVGGSYRVSDPYIAMIATTTPVALSRATDEDDLRNGFLSRFLICAPDTLDEGPQGHITGEERIRLARELAGRVRALENVARVVPDAGAALALAEHETQKGRGTGRVRNLDLEWKSDEIPTYRLVAAVKKVATLLALAGEALPQGDTLATTAGDVGLAIRIVERANAYAVRVSDYVGGAKGKDVRERVAEYLRVRGGWRRQRQILMDLRLHVGEVAPVLAEFLAEGLIERAEDGRTVAYRWRVQQGGQR